MVTVSYSQSTFREETFIRFDLRASMDSTWLVSDRDEAQVEALNLEPHLNTATTLSRTSFKGRDTYKYKAWRDVIPCLERVEIL